MNDFLHIILEFFVDIFYWRARNKIIENQQNDVQENNAEEQINRKENSSWEDMIEDEEK